MVILAVSTSAKYPSAALSKGGELLAFRIDESGLSHMKTIFGLIDSVLAETNTALPDVDAFAVDIGPGSFMGVRIGVSAVNAMAYALKKPVLPVSSLAALRHMTASSGAVAAIIDARNGNGYAAVYNNGRETVAPCPCIIKDITDALPEGAEIVGDCCGHYDICNAMLVLDEVAAIGVDSLKTSEAIPMYLRPSQAERMRK